MNQIEGLEHSLPDRLQSSAALVTPDPSALAVVRQRAAARRRRNRIGALASCAAAIAVVAVGATVLGGQEPSFEVSVSPADGSRPETTQADDADATLIIYRYPNASSEIVAEDPKMGGEWAMLHTADRTYYANGPLSELGADSPFEDSNLGAALATLDAHRGLDAGRAISELIDSPYSGVTSPTTAPEPTTAPDQPDDQYAESVLFGLLASGSCTADQATEVRRLLETLPSVTAVESGTDITLFADQSGVEMAVTYDSSTGTPVRRTFAGSDLGDIEYVSVARVRAVDYLLPGRGTPNSPSTSTTTTEAPR